MLQYCCDKRCIWGKKSDCEGKNFPWGHLRRGPVEAIGREVGPLMQGRPKSHLEEAAASARQPWSVCPTNPL